MSCYLCIIVDCDSNHWGELIEKENNDDLFDFLIESIMAFAVAHLSFQASNRIAIFGVDSTLHNPLLYSSLISSQLDLMSIVNDRLIEVLTASAENTNNTTSNNKLCSAVTAAFCHINRFKKENGDSEGRILIINMGGNLARQQNSLMNVFFAAHKHNIVVDVAEIGKPSPVLQQAADITAGIYLSIEKPFQIFQKVTSMVLGDLSGRSIFNSWVPPSVDYRASCHCHGTPVSIGWVCSVCLCIQCQFAPICPICGTVFNIMGLARRSRKRRKEVNDLLQEEVQRYRGQFQTMSGKL